MSLASATRLRFDSPLFLLEEMISALFDDLNAVARISDFYRGSSLLCCMKLVGLGSWCQRLLSVTGSLLISAVTVSLPTQKLGLVSAVVSYSLLPLLVPSFLSIKSLNSKREVMYSSSSWLSSSRSSTYHLPLLLRKG